ncbi:MAG: CotH kinase family protein [Acidobacteria bacterium]|nr:CotH kinase family protein [Acidobacteriota bacterium]
MHASNTSLVAFLFLALCASEAATPTQEDFFDDRVLHDIRIRIHPADWRSLQDHFRENTYYACEMEWRDIVTENIALRSRGWSTRNPVKPGLRVDFNRYEDQDFLGLKSIVLDNLGQDASGISERVAMLFFRRMGLPASRETHARVYVNDEYLGLYAVVDPVDKQYLKRNFGKNDGYLYEYRPREGYHFEYLGSDLSLYSPGLFEARTHENNPDPAPLEAMFRIMNQASGEEFPRAMAKYLDLKLFMTYLATENYLADAGGLLSDFGPNNFYLYRFEGKKLSQLLPWDKDYSFDDEQRSVWRNKLDVVLVRRAWAVPELRAAYLEALLKCAALAGGTPYSPVGWLEQEMVRQYSQIRSALREDPNKQCGYKPCSNQEVEDAVLKRLHFARYRSEYVLGEVSADGFQFSETAPRVDELATLSSADWTAGSTVSVYGQGLGDTTTQAESWPYPTQLAGVSISINGFLARIESVTPTQVNFVLPPELESGWAPVTAIVKGSISNTITVGIASRPE